MHKYKKLGTAGEGAYGIVLKCKCKNSGKLVAIKQFRENDAEDEEAARVMQREVNILRTLKHENIVDMKEVFREKGTLCIVFEYVEKCLLDVIHLHETGLGVEITRKLIFQLTRAIEHCHDHHVIHRDIKPDNLLINPVDHSLRLCDFGSACKISSKQILTDYAATRWYRAPELLVRFNDYGPGVDMWGLGCVMAELLTGQPFFAGQTDLDQLFIINNALGPLTPQQTERCLDLTDFVKFPEVGERQTLQKRIGRVGTEQQMRFLTRTLVVDPAQRLTAKAALSMPWLTDWSASSLPLVSMAARALTQQTGADPDLGLQSKPRVRNATGALCPVSAKERLPVGITAGAGESNWTRLQEPELESIASCQLGSSKVQQGSRKQLDDPCEESILEESFLEESIGEEISAEAGEQAILQSTIVTCSGSLSVGIVAGAKAMEAHEPSQPIPSHPEGSVPEHKSLPTVCKPSEQVMPDTLTPLEERLSTRFLEQCEDSIIEELVESRASALPDVPVTPQLPPSVATAEIEGRGSKTSLHAIRLIRPVSRCSATSSLTPIS